MAWWGTGLGEAPARGSAEEILEGAAAGAPGVGCHRGCGIQGWVQESAEANLEEGVVAEGGTHRGSGEGDLAALGP